MTGVSQSTLRAWESEGLLTPNRGESGHRTFDDSDIARVRKIEALRRMQGLSLSAIRGRLEPAASDDARAGPKDAETAGNVRGDAKTFGYAALGQKVRELRRQRGATLSAFASEVGMTPSHLSMFERGKAFPSPSKLAAIASAVDKSLAEMLGATVRHGSIVTRRGSGRQVDVFGPDVRVEQLNVGEALMDCEIWSLEPGARSSGAYAHTGEELIFVLEGAFDLAVDGAPYETLQQGDSAYFDSARPHRWRNSAPQRAVLLWVNTETGRLVPDAHARASGRAGQGREHGVKIPKDARTFHVVDTHTAGHPTRVFTDPLDDPGFLGLQGETVREMRDDFRVRYDHLRPLLLHEPRGHAATFGLVPVPSTVADFGAIFVSSYAYLDMCGHGTIGFARTLQALGRLPESGAFTLETPAGVVKVTTRQTDRGLETSFENVASRLERESLEIEVPSGRLRVDIAYGGCRYALVRAADLELTLSTETVGQAMAAGAAIKAAANDALTAIADGPAAPVDSVLFFEDIKPGHWRQLVVLAENKFDRSPCGTGASARLAERVARGVFGQASKAVVENILGLHFGARVARVEGTSGFPTVTPVITGTAHLSGITTLIAESDEPLATGFLCQ